MLSPYAAPNSVEASAKGSVCRAVGRSLLLFGGVVFGMQIGLSMMIGFEETVRRFLRDPLGMAGAAFVVTGASVLAAPCYRLLRNRLSPVRESRALLALPFGVVFGASTVLALLGSSELLTWLVTASVRDSWPAHVDFVLLVPAVIVGTVSAVEFEQLLARFLDKPRGGSQ